jgi:hypothetical protein
VLAWYCNSLFGDIVKTDNAGTTCRILVLMGLLDFVQCLLPHFSTDVQVVVHLQLLNRTPRAHDPRAFRLEFNLAYPLGPKYELQFLLFKPWK